MAEFFPSDQIKKVCGIIQDAFSEIYHKGIPVLVPNWQAVVEKRLSKPGKPYQIQIEKFDKSGDQIWGMLQRWDGGATIWVTADKTLCWRRYIAAKELAHLLIDTPKDYTQKPSTLMSQLINGIPLWALKKDGHHDQEAFDSERVAMSAAAEMLVPWTYRDYFYKLEQKGGDNLEIAREFMVPQHVVSNMRSEVYSQLSRVANEAHVKSKR